MYKLVYKSYAGFLKEMKKYNEKYKHLKEFKEKKKERMKCASRLA